MNVFASLLFLASVGSAFSFKLNLTTGSITPPAWVTWHQALNASGTCSKRGTLKIDMTDHTNVRFDFKFANTKNGWVVNIGDSSTNDGDGGDDGTQERNCEAQLYESTFAVFRNEQQPGLAFNSSSSSPSWSVGNNLRVIVKDGYIKWENLAGASGFLSNTTLYYALGNQSDDKGPNKDIYLGMNQVVKGTKTGDGLCSVAITFDVPE